MEWEVSLMEWLQANVGNIGIEISKIFSTIGGEKILLFVMLATIFCYRKETGKRLAMSTLAASMWFPMIKNVVLRLRPYMEHPDRVKMLKIVEADADAMDVAQQGYSFPSGHAATTVTVFGSIARDVKKRWCWWVTILLVLFVGISRFVLGVHYPTDVLAGWVIGLAAMGFTTLLEKKVEKEWVRYLILAAVTVPGIFWCRSRDYFSALGLLIGAMIAFPYEKKYINFQDTRNVWAMIVRLLGAAAIYFVLDKLLKMPFSAEFLNDGTMGSYLVRSARYAVVLFVEIGVYPRLFPVFEKIGQKK